MNLYMVFVEKSRAPKRIHETIEIAQGEAARLSKLIPYKKVYILEIVGTVEPTEARPEVVPKVIVAKVKSTNTLSMPKKNVAA